MSTSMTDAYVRASCSLSPTPTDDVATCQPFDVTTLEAPDGSITAKFVSYGATMTELWVKDKFGKPRDIILGYDDPVCICTHA